MKQSHLFRAAAFAALLSACADDPSQPGAPTPQFSVASERTMVVFKSEIPADFEATVASLGGSVELTDAALGMASVSGLSAEGAASLARHGGVLAVEPDHEVSLDPQVIEGAEALSDVIQSPANPATAFFYPRQWNMRVIRANSAWAAGRLGSSSVKVAILDTGLDYTHSDMVGRVDMTLSTSFITTDPIPVGRPAWLDRHYHGTHVGATVSSNANAAAGVTSRVKLIAVKVLSASGSGSTSGVLAGIRYAADAGADVINMSLGSAFSKSSFPGFVSVINRAINYANRKGTTIVVAAGNAGWDLDHNGNGFAAYCNAPNVICVSATGPTSQRSVNGPWANIDALAGYSNFGRSSINVAAPGGNGATFVWAACNRFSLIVPICGTGTFILGVRGTSMAAPHVSGLAALLAEQYGKSPAKIRAAIQKGAIDLGAPGTDPAYGKGRIDVPNSIGL